MSAAPRLVTVVLPTHNHGRYLDAALRSVLAQRGVSLDVIVVDDGSTDDTAAVLAPWLEQGVRLLRQPQRGASAARNRGIAMARGEHLAFLDADDQWPRTDMLDAALACLAEDPALGWTFGDAQPFTEDLAGQHVFIDRPYLLSGGRYQSPGPHAARTTVTAADLCNDDRFFIPTGSAVIRRRCLDEVGGFDEGLRMFEDTDLWLRLLRYPVAFFPDVLLWRRVHDSNLSHRRWAHLDDLRVLFERHGLERQGVPWAFHAARAHYGAGREAWRAGRFAAAAAEFGRAFAQRRSVKAGLGCVAASLAARLRPGGQDAD